MVRYYSKRAERADLAQVELRRLTGSAAAIMQGSPRGSKEASSAASAGLRGVSQRGTRSTTSL